MRPSKLLYICLLLIVAGCQEENALIETHPDIEKAKNWFIENEGKLSTLTKANPSTRGQAFNFTKQPDWSKSKVYNAENGHRAVEVFLDYDTYLVPSDKRLGPARPNVVQSMLLFETKQGEYKVYLLKFYPENPSTKLNKGHFSKLNYGKIPGDFSGKLMVFDWNENFIGGWQISNGRKTEHIAKTVERKSESNGRTSGGCYMVTTDWYVSVCTEDGSYCTDWLLYDSDMNLHCDYIAPQVPQPPDGGGGDGGGGSGGGNSGGGGSGGGGNEECLTPDEFFPDLMVPCDLDEAEMWEGDVCKEAGFVQNPCLQNVWSKMENTNAAYSTLKGFLVDKPAATLCLDGSSQGTTGSNGTTSVSGTTIKIDINTDRLNRSQLSIARTILHELIHAELYRKVKSVNNQVSPEDFPGIYDYYRRFIKNWQHQQMAGHYVSIIAAGLASFDNNQHSASLYEAVAWEGLWKIEDYNNPNPDGTFPLIESEAWKSLGSAQQSSIQSTISNYIQTENKNCQ